MRTAPSSLTPSGLLGWAVKPTPRQLVVLIATLMGVWICELSIPLLLGEAVDAAVSRTGGMQSIVHLGAAVMAVAALLYLLHTTYLRAETRLVARGTFRLRQYLYTRLLEQPLSFFSTRRKGEIAHRLMSDAEVIDSHAIYLIADIPFSALTVVGVFSVMLWMEPMLALLVSGVLVAVAAVSHRVGRPFDARERLVRHRWARLGGRLQESLDAFRTVKSFGREEFEMQRLDRSGEDLMRAETAVGQVLARLEPLTQLTGTFGFLSVIWYGGILVYDGTITPGRLVAFIAYVELMREPVRDAGLYYAHFRQSLGTLARIGDFLKMLAPPRRGGDATANGPFGIEIRDICFTYPGRERAALDGISISASPGETIVVTGENGAGKSTLLDAILGLLSPDRGSIHAGGIPLENWCPDAWRNATATVPQEIVLFHASIEDNIRYGAPDPTAADVGAAIDRAGLAEVIARLPRGIKTVVGERGAQLSGGERQRVALARALVGMPRLLVLDEPGSALDRATLGHIVENLRADRENRVTFVITHDPQLVAGADRVIVLDGGRVVRAYRTRHPETVESTSRENADAA